MCEHHNTLVSSDFHGYLLQTASDLALLQDQTFLLALERMKFKRWWSQVRPNELKDRLRIFSDLENYKFPPLPNRFGSGVFRSRRFLAGAFQLSLVLEQRLSQLQTGPEYLITRGCDLHHRWLKLEAEIAQEKQRIRIMTAEQGALLHDWLRRLPQVRSSQLISEIVLSVSRPPSLVAKTTYMESAIRQSVRTRRFLHEFIGSRCNLKLLCAQLQERYYTSISIDASLDLEDDMLM